jgi:uncharacterized protein (TIGR00369 family)
MTPMERMTPKPARESYVEMTEIVHPEDTNAMGNIFGGKVVSLMDVAGAIAAMRHARRPVVTASIDRVDFHNPVRTGQIIRVLASVNYTARTSLEVGVRVESENPSTGERRHTASAYLTFVALDDLGRPTAVPPLLPETDEEKQRFEAGRTRRAERVARLERKRAEGGGA